VVCLVFPEFRFCAAPPRHMTVRFALTGWSVAELCIGGVGMGRLDPHPPPILTAVFRKPAHLGRLIDCVSVLARQAGALKWNLLVIPESRFLWRKRCKYWRALARGLLALVVMEDGPRAPPRRARWRH
jgi:hypothetical protein